MGFQVGLVLPGHGECVFHDNVGLCKTLVDVPLAPGILGKAVGGLRQLAGQPSVAVDLRMQNGSSLFQGFRGIEDRRQFLVFDVNTEQGFLRRVPVHGGNRGHPIADKPDVVVRQNRNVVQASAVPDAPHVPPGQHGVDPRHLQGPGNIDVEDAGVGVRAAKGRSPEGPRQRHVGCVQGFPGHFLPPVHPGACLADGRVRSHLAFSNSMVRCAGAQEPPRRREAAMDCCQISLPKG